MNPEPDFGNALIETFAGPPRMFRVSEFAAREMKPRLEIVPGMIPCGQVTSADGAGGGGKSTLFGVQLSVCAVSGRSWLGMPVRRGPAIYLASEDDTDELQRRTDAACVYYRLSFSDLDDMHVWPLAADEPALVVPGRDDTLEATARWHQLVAAVERIRPVLLVLDSRADVFGGNEVSRAQARGFIGMLRKLAIQQDVAIVLLGHPSLAGLSSGSGSSGSTHWRNAVRSGLHLRRPDDPLAHPDLRVLEVVKSNYSAAGQQINLRWSCGVFEVEEGAAAPTNREEAAAEVDCTFLRLLTTYNAQGRRVSDQPGANYAPSVFAQDPARSGATKAGFMAAMLRLFGAGSIRVDEVGPASKRRRQLVIVEPFEVAA